LSELASGRDGRDGRGSADLVLVGGSVLTMDESRSTAAAVAVRGGRIVAVGRDSDVEPLIGPVTRRIELAGRTLLPGFQDAHVHPSMAGVGLLRCPLHELPRTLNAYLEAIATYAAAHRDAEWVLGDGWYMEAFPGGTPSRRDLDRVVPDRPAFFVNRDAHGAWVNTRALEIAGLTADSPDPPDGRIEREPDGTPGGTLHEGAMERFREIVPEPTIDEIVEGLELAQAYLLRLGITAWQDAWVEPDELEAYRVFAERGRLVGRATACHWWQREAGSEQIESIVERRSRADGLGRLRANTVKIMLDGVAENYTAAMLEPYRGADGTATPNRGISFVEPGALKRHVTELDSLGFQVHFHALGDRAVREGLDAVEAALDANGPSDRRHHLAHLQLVDPADVARFAPLGAVANIQPFWACNDRQMTDLTLPFLPPDRATLQYPFRSLLAAGATIAGGSDWTVSTPNVLMEVETAVNRVSPEDRSAAPFLPEQALDPLDALAAFTRGSAYVNHLDDVTGSIEVGKLADLVALDRDILAPDAGPLGDARVVLTLVEGDVVHEDPAAVALSR
jgi:predicted amidohydrolase YtcJ